MGLAGVLIEEKDVIVVAWVLRMYECGFSIKLQQLKMQVAKLTQTRPTSFKHGVSWKT
jgi:hypothetical protein